MVIKIILYRLLEKAFEFLPKQKEISTYKKIDQYGRNSKSWFSNSVGILSRENMYSRINTNLEI